MALQIMNKETKYEIMQISETLLLLLQYVKYTSGHVCSL